MSAAKPRLYLETSVVSYYAARPSRDVVVAGRQETTRQSWSALEARFDRFVSELVLSEAAAGDREAAQKRLEAVAALPVLTVSADAEALAAKLVSRGAIPRRHPEDALHIAVAACNGADYLLTWNFAHINNAATKQLISDVVEDCGYTCPVICTPDELLGGAI